MTQPDDAALLAAELLARRWLPRQHPRVRRALVDADLWAAVQDRLAAVGLRLVDNIYADHVTVALLRPVENAVFGDTGLATHNNIDLPRDAISLLVVLWALIVLPKRERQAARQGDAGQAEMFAAERPLPAARQTSPVVAYRALLADFGAQLGRKTRLDANLKRLENHGFIVRRGDDIAEGPLLDLLLDYDVLAPRVLEGTLAEVLQRARQRVLVEPDALPVDTPGPDAEASTTD
ncbi:MAG: DUF4194 domain-containing protein [Tepidimonas ignava]|uniref:DUF4194 domain-containing protein n=1 Tax=Tepidimonas ignava TaxID=114249 RepID=A0A4R3LHJ5_9BURK|nr:DUF4194 domain-containing protein [Tepidimonas ignava]MCX7815737.1 DUF4194 domain-containing protein [Tepidimonas ignava]TCS98968.1 hypothetical protein EDC36_10324 [Tepidimonas ignava]TSE22949.1 hypothetical protein Tigna_00931 [Tepidimonas ignava]